MIDQICNYVSDDSVVAVFKYRPASKIVYFLACISTIIGIILLINIQYWLPSSALNGDRYICASLTCILFAVIGIFFLAISIFKDVSKKEYEIRYDGIAINTGGDKKYYSWSEFSSIKSQETVINRNGLDKKRHYKYLFCNDFGKKISLNSSECIGIDASTGSFLSSFSGLPLYPFE